MFSVRKLHGLRTVAAPGIRSGSKNLPTQGVNGAFRSSRGVTYVSTRNKKKSGLYLIFADL